MDKIKYLQQARKFYEAAKDEFLVSRKNGDELKIRQAAEKGWGAVVQATNALLVKKGMKVPKGTRRREDLLFEIQDKDKKIKNLNLGEKYGYLLRSLHSDCFYDGDISIKRIERDLRKVEEYINAVSKL